MLLLAAPDHLTPDAAANWRAVERSGITCKAWPSWNDADLAAELGRAEWAVDAIYGTGLAGRIRSPMEQAIAMLNNSPARIFAVDLPSGLDGDSGAPLGVAVRAHHTATFVAPKIGFVNAAAAAWLGTVHVIDIGVPPGLLTGVEHPT